MKKLFLLILSFLGLTVCMGAKNFEDLDTKDFAKYIENKDVQLVDVRTPEEYTEGHIPGAENINVQASDFLSDAEKSLSKSRPVAVYCRSGKRSAVAATLLTKAGYNVVNLDGGILAWEQAGELITK